MARAVRLSVVSSPFLKSVTLHAQQPDRRSVLKSPDQPSSSSRSECTAVA
jgi:hypothetical protein